MKRLYLAITVAVISLVLWGEATITQSYEFEANGDYAAALSVMQELQTKEPTDGFYQLRLAWLQYLNSNYGEAAIAYRKASQLNDSLDARLGLINSLLAMGRYADALAETRSLAERFPQNTVVLAKGGYAAYMLKDYRSAADFFSRISIVTPWDMENRGYLMNNLYLSGQESEARQQYLFLSKYYPASPLLTSYRKVFEP